MRELFRVWSDGSEPAFAAYLWGVLGRRGLIDVGSPVERAVSVCRLATVAALHREFCARTGDADEGDWREVTDVVVGDYPRIDPITLGRVAERFALRPHGTGEREESPTGLVEAFIESEHRVVAGALLEEMGVPRLFATMWMTRSVGTRYPMTDEVLGQVVNEDLDERGRAFGWVREGMHL